ncbi:Uncharacterised protein [Mycobacteroides abscessus subsp. abscessus]|nr:Uncharacterised protein [Mycobacteroides abscessus subsp. abscessus]
MPSHILATAPNVPVISLLAITNCTRTIAAMMTNATADGPNATVSSARACAGLAREGWFTRRSGADGLRASGSSKP